MDTPYESDDKKFDSSIEHVDRLESRPHKKPFVTPEQRQAALEEAIKQDPGIHRFSWAQFQMYLITLVACCCSGDSGFDGTVMGGVNAMAQYQSYFGLNGSSDKTSIVFGIYTVGNICGTIPASYLPDRFGRRFSMFAANAFLLAGAILTANAHNEPMFLAGRWMTGVGSGCAGASAKSYLAEITPPASRGAYMGFLNSFYYIGQMAATGMMVSTGRWDNELSWRLPLYIQAIPAGLNVLLVYLCPESPRWLYSVGKKDQARAILAKFHSRTRDLNSPVVNIEIDEIEEKVTLEGADKRWWDFRPLFRTSTDRYRMSMVIMIGAFGQLSGNGMITYFLPQLLKNAGIIDQNRILTLNFVNSVTSYVSALGGSFTVDYFGRRKILLFSTGAITICLAIVTGLLSNPSDTNPVRVNAGITFIYLFMCLFSYGWTPMQALYPAEVLGYESRAKGLAFLGLITSAAGCINTFGLPVALDKITWKVYLIFCIWDAFEFVVIYFFTVETKGYSLEEIEEIFDHPSPVQYSKKLQKVKKDAGKAARADAEGRNNPVSAAT